MLAVLTSTHFITTGGYVAILILSIAQSCCIPTSSEIVMALGGYLAYKHQLSLEGVIAAGAGGELIGADLAWVIGRFGGRGFVHRWGRYVLLTNHDLDRAEAWYGRHRRGGVLLSRFIPVVRNFVALVAGVAEVPLVTFGIFTLLGSLVWDGAWAVFGYSVGSSYTHLAKDFSDAGYVIAVLIVAALVFLIWHRRKRYLEYRAIDDRAAALQAAAEGPDPVARDIDDRSGRGRHFRRGGTAEHPDPPKGR